MASAKHRWPVTLSNIAVFLVAAVALNVLVWPHLLPVRPAYVALAAIADLISVALWQIAHIGHSAK